MKKVLIAIALLCAIQTNAQQVQEKTYDVKMTIQQASSIIFVLNKSNESHAAVQSLIDLINSQMVDQINFERTQKAKADSIAAIKPKEEKKKK